MSSLFGTQTNNQNKPGGPFGSSFASSQPQQSGSLFGQATSQPQQTSSLFGTTTSQPQQTSTLFGGTASQPQQQQGGGLFGNLGQQQQQQQPQQQNTSLFGQPQQQQQPQGGGSFGLNQPSQTGSLFGNTQQQNAPQTQQGGGLFGPLGANAQQNQQPTGGSVLGASLAPTTFGGSRLGWNPTTSIATREKTIPEQMEIMLHKWSSQSPDCVFTHYFYNNVDPNTVPYFAPGPGEDVAKWEEALSKKPGPGAVPVLGKGFAAIGERLKIQSQAATSLQSRLHEINNSLVAMMQNFDLSIGVRQADARRKHTALAQRTLALAAKVQVLRNRGYALDATEEELKKKIAVLEKGVMDPTQQGRQEEIWARMVAIRQRVMMLKEEGEKLGQKGENGDSEIGDEVLTKTKRILGDYDTQLSYLRKELDSTRKDLQEWEKTTRPGVNA
ncbi:MAG: hypothetical protein M1820_009727 [Bogoriella megaspora]|nr:MAG: hypothetical protein M1820_009727 [Bogoriella megaspora]